MKPVSASLGSMTTALSRCSPTRWPPVSTSTPGSAAWFPRSRRARIWRRWAPRCAAPLEAAGCAQARRQSPQPSAPGWPVRCWWEWLRPKHIRAAWQVPFYAVNHLGGHLAADVYDHGPLPESVGLLVSGGHTNLLHVRSLASRSSNSAAPVDDAAGEAYDQVARLLGLGYPGGKVARRPGPRGPPRRNRLPRGMTGPRDDPHAFSFSGLKTAVARYVERSPPTRRGPISRRASGGGRRGADAQGRPCRDRAWGVDAVDRRRGSGELAAAGARRRAVHGVRVDASDRAAAAVHR